MPTMSRHYIAARPVPLSPQDAAVFGAGFTVDFRGTEATPPHSPFDTSGAQEKPMQTSIKRPSRAPRNLAARISKHEAMLEALQRNSRNTDASIAQLRREKFALTLITACREISAKRFG
jgi:hypothetical protein